MTHPIERASVKQARKLWADTVEPLGYPQNAATIRSGDLDPFQQATAGIIAKLLEDRQQACDAGFAEGVERAAAYHDARAEKWTKESHRHTRKGGYRSDCEQRDLERARQHRLFATAIRALSAEANEGRCDG